MKKTNNIVLFILLFYSLTTKEQIIGPNLVQNPSFEEYYNCPGGSGQLFESKYWWGISCDYFNTCSPPIPLNVSVPLNFAGYQYAHTGNAYAGCCIYASGFINYDYIETLKTKLNDTLIANKRYCTKFYISLAESSYYYNPNDYIFLDSIGMLFTNNLVQDTAPIAILSNGIRVQNDIFNIDTVNWFNISNSFIANGGEQYLTIGNFDNIINIPFDKQVDLYVYVDDVSVCECSFSFSLGNDTTLCNGETLLLNPNLTGATYTWQDSSHASTYNVTQAGTYWVRAYFADYNITTSASINVTYNDSCFKIPNIFTPNGDGYNDNFVIQNTYGWNINLQVFNRWGVLVYEDNNYQNNWGGKSKGKDVADGVYYYVIKAKNLSSGYETQYHGSLTIMR